MSRLALLCLLAFGANHAAADSEVSAADTLLLASDYAEDKVTVFRVNDGRLGSLAQIATGKDPEEIAITADGSMAYIANAGDDTISVLDLATLKVVRTLSPPQLKQTAEKPVRTPFGLAVSRDGQKLYVAGRGRGALFIMSPTGQVLGEVPVASISNVVLSADGSRLYALGFHSQKLFSIDTRTNAVLGSVETGRQPKGIALTPDGKTIIVALVAHSALQFIDAQTLAVKAIIGAGRSPQSPAVTPDGQLAFVGTRDLAGGGDLSSISVVNLRKEQYRQVQSYVVGSLIERIAVSSDGGFLYATVRSVTNPDATLLVMDLRTMEIVQFPRAGAKAMAIAIRNGTDSVATALSHTR